MFGPSVWLVSSPVLDIKFTSFPCHHLRLSIKPASPSAIQFLLQKTSTLANVHTSYITEDTSKGSFRTAITYMETSLLSYSWIQLISKALGPEVPDGTRGPSHVVLDVTKFQLTKLKLYINRLAVADKWNNKMEEKYEEYKRLQYAYASSSCFLE